MPYISVDKENSHGIDIYYKAPHGLATTHKQQLNEDLLAFIKG